MPIVVQRRYFFGGMAIKNRGASPLLALAPDIDSRHCVLVIVPVPTSETGTRPGRMILPGFVYDAHSPFTDPTDDGIPSNALRHVWFRILRLIRCRHKHRPAHEFGHTGRIVREELFDKCLQVGVTGTVGFQKGCPLVDRKINRELENLVCLTSVPINLRYAS